MREGAPVDELAARRQQRARKRLVRRFPRLWVVELGRWLYVLGVF